jgi:hypothetical protein
LVKLNDVRKAFKNVLLTDQIINVSSISPTGTRKVGVLSTFSSQPFIENLLVSAFGGLIPKGVSKNHFELEGQKHHIQGDTSYYITGTMCYDNLIIDIREVKNVNIFPSNMGGKLLINYEEYETNIFTPNQLAVKHNCILIKYDDGEYEVNPVDGRWLHLSNTIMLYPPTTSSTDGTFISCGGTTLVAIDVDNKSTKTFNQILEYINIVQDWTTSYIFSSSNKGYHVYLEFPELYNTLPIFNDISCPMCEGFRKWVLSSSHQVIRRGVKLRNPESDITLLAIVEREPNKFNCNIYTKFKTITDVFSGSRTINLRT